MSVSDMSEYLSLLEELTTTLERLTAVQQRKTEAVRVDDLATLNDCIKQEQALSLTLRGFEQKRIGAVSALGLSKIPLSALASHCPVGSELRAKAVSEELLRQYQLYRSASDVARTTLECNLHQIEKLLSDTGAPPVSGAGYGTSEIAPPAGLRSDFHA